MINGSQWFLNQVIPNFSRVAYVQRKRGRQRGGCIHKIIIARWPPPLVDLRGHKRGLYPCNGLGYREGYPRLYDYRHATHSSDDCTFPRLHFSIFLANFLSPSGENYIELSCIEAYIGSRKYLDIYRRKLSCPYRVCYIKRFEISLALLRDTSANEFSKFEKESLNLISILKEPFNLVQ